MKLTKVLKLSGAMALLLVVCPLKYHLCDAASGWVDIEADHQKVASKADNVNGIDLHNVSVSDNTRTTASGRHSIVDADEIHSRAKRFIAFPVGSSFSTAVCLTTGVIGNPNYQYLSMGLNWGIAYDLPNSTWVLEHAKGFGAKDDKGALIKRRHRRDLYGKLETLITGLICCIKILVAISTCGDLLKFFLLQNSNFVSCESLVRADVNAISTGNNFSVKNQVVLDTLQLKSLGGTGGNDLLSVTTTCNTDGMNNKTTRENVSTSWASSTTNSSSLSSAASSELWSSSSSPEPPIPQHTFSSSSSSPSSSVSSKSSSMSLQQRLLSRPKRYLSFPEGASFSVAVCFTVGIIGNPRFNYMAFGLNWGVAYDLPNTTWILNHLHGFAKRPIPVAMWHRRSRRALYNEIESFVDNMGYNGRDCVLRALCESRQYFQNTKMGMIGEMLRAIFSLPKQRIYRRELDEDSDMPVYDRAYRRARSADSFVDCSSQYDCSFSLLELAFGKYSTPPPGYYEHH